MTSRLVDMPASDEAEDVEEWRIDRLLELGFAADDAVFLAVAGIDWHDAARLLEAGCDHDTALRILA